MKNHQETSTPEQIDQVQNSTKPDFETNKNGHPALNRNQKLLFRIAIGILLVVLVIWIAGGFFSQVTKDDAPTSHETVAGTSVSSSDRPSETHLKNVEAANQATVEQAKQKEDLFVEPGFYEFTVPEVTTSAESLTQMTGAGADEPVDKTDEVNEREPIQEQDPSSKTVERQQAKETQNEKSVATAQNRKSIVAKEVRQQRLNALRDKFNTSSTQSGAWKPKSGIRMSHIKLESEETPDAQSGGATVQMTDGVSAVTGIDLTPPGTSDISNSQNTIEQGRGRGLRAGDLLVGQLINGLNSDAPSPVALVEVLSDPLKGAQITFTPQYLDSTIMYASEQLSYLDNYGSLSAIIVTPDENLTTGFHTDVDHHTLQKWAAIIMHGVGKGTGSYIKTLGGTVAVNGQTVIQDNEFDPLRLGLASVGGVAESATSSVEKYIDRPSTVTAASREIVGIYITKSFNPPWFPYIPKHKTRLW